MIHLKEFLLNNDQLELALCRDNLTLTCPEKQRPCSNRCPFFHIEKNKVIIACRSCSQYFFIEEAKNAK